MSNLHAVLAVDPGKASGITLITWTGNPDDIPVIVFSEEAQAEDFAQWIRRGLAGWEVYSSFKVACERFVINAQTVRNSQAPYSLEQIGVLKQLCREDNYPVDSIVFQAPVDAKNMFPNPALKTLGTWHRGGEGHALDAIRHGLLALARGAKWIPRALLKDS